MFQKDFFQKLHAQYRLFSQKRIQIIGYSNEILRLSKQVIFSLQRDGFNDAENFLDQAENFMKKTLEILKEDYHLESEGAYKAGVEEYVEAKFFYDFLKKKKINFYAKYHIGTDEYIGGLSDFTGEMVRRCVLQATKRNVSEVKRAHGVIEDIVEKMAEFHVTGKNRQKFDDAKRNLKRVEEILYDLELHRR